MVTLRQYQPTDKNLVYATFLKSLYYGNTYYRSIDQDAYFAGYGKVLNFLTTKSGVDIRIACLHDEPDVIVGYAIVEYGMLHYVYVKTVWRNQGIAKLLLQGLELNSCTHLTTISKDVKILSKLKFNPFLIGE